MLDCSLERRYRRVFASYAVKADVKIHKREQQGFFSNIKSPKALVITDKDKEITKVLRTHRGGFFFFASNAPEAGRNLQDMRNPSVVLLMYANDESEIRNV